MEIKREAYTDGNMIQAHNVVRLDLVIVYILTESRTFHPL